MLPIAIKFFIRLTAVSTLCFGAFISGSTQATTLVDTAQKSIVYIFFDVVDPNTGAKSTIQGTGFVISPQGYVLTASHLFRAWKAQRPVDKANNPIKATLRDKVGYVTESPLILNRVNIGDPDQEDVALLKLPTPSQDYPVAPICFRQAAAARVGDQLMAFGFPHDQNFQPVPGILGMQNAPDGRWAAASAFAEGMSGGPVYVGEIVVGLVKGGLDINAVNWITPIGFAGSLFNIAGAQERCASPVKMGTLLPEKLSYWMHNGSLMLLRPEGARRQIVYVEPRPGMRAEGVKQGTVVFEGSQIGAQYTGTAYVFSGRCNRSYPYSVTGSVSNEGRKISLFGGDAVAGLSPDCKVTARRDDLLIFDFDHED